MKYILCFLLVTAGFFVLLNIKLSDIFIKPFNKNNIKLSDIHIKPFDEKRKIRKQIRIITGKKKGSLERTLDNAKEMLIASNMEKQARRYKVMAFVFAFAGVIIGLAIDNILVSVVLGIGLATIPLVIIYIRTGEYTKALNEKLENALNTITNNYVQSGELISSIEKSVHLIPAPIDVVFKQFLVDINLDNNIVKAIHKLSNKIDNRYFRDWCYVLSQCQYDSSLRVALLSIVSRLSEMKILRMQADTIIKKHIGEYVKWTPCQGQFKKRA